MKLTINEIAQIIGGFVSGSGEEVISSIASIEKAEKGSISFLSNPVYTTHLYTSNASAIIVNDAFQIAKPVKSALITVSDASKAFSTLLSHVAGELVQDKKGIEQPSYIHNSAQIGASCYIGAFSYIGENAVIGDNVQIYPHVYIGENCKVGDQTTLHPGVKLYANSEIGMHCCIHAGSIIGSAGFGLIRDEKGRNKPVPQIG